MGNELVSVMVPTYGQAEYISRTIESVLVQDYPRLEIVVVDDGSPDRTEVAVSRYLSDPRVRYYRNESNLGRVRNYRHALYDLARGKYVTNLDGDDLLGEHSYLRRSVEALEQHPTASMCFGRVIRFMGDPPEISKSDVLDCELLDGTEFFKDYWRRTNTIHHLGTVYRKQAALDFYRRDIISADIESLLRLMPGNTLIRMNAVAGLWRGHAMNASVAIPLSAALENLEMIDSVATDDVVTDSLDSAAISRWRSRMLHHRIYGSATTHFFSKGRYREGLEYLRQSIIRYPWVAFRLLTDARLWVYLVVPRLKRKT